MQLTEKYPKDKEVRKYVDKYQLYDIGEPSYLKTIPNGKLECWIIWKGGFQILNTADNRFIDAMKTGGYPATDQSLLFKINEQMLVLNIKFNLRMLGFREFNTIYPPRLDFNLEDIFPDVIIDSLYSPDLRINKDFDLTYLDKTMRALIASLTKNDEDVIQFIETVEGAKGDLNELRNKLNFTPKTLERWTKKYFHLTPKKLVNIFRFDRTTSLAKEEKTRKLMNLLVFGYYDQPHFVRECKKITGLTPTELFDKLKFPTNDLLVGKKAM
jgi:AraC-like DNA-binding protein